MDETGLRAAIPAVIGVLVRRGVDFATAEDAVQEALVSALHSWPENPPRDEFGWLVTASWRKVIDTVRSESARRRREEAIEPPPEPVPARDDTLALYFLCAHPDLSSSAGVALTLRAVAGLTTAQIARAHLVPEATMAQRISRAKRTLRDRRLDRPGDLSTVLRVLYLIFNEGYGGDVDLAVEATRVTRQLRTLVDEPEVDGLLALILIHHARRASRTDAHGRLVPLAEQDRTAWDEPQIAAAVDLLQTALAEDRLGQYQAQAAIAALHADARSTAQTDWPQIVGWYDELLRLTADSPVVRLNRAVAIGEADGPAAGLAALRDVPADTPRRTAALAHLHERSGELDLAADEYTSAAAAAESTAERDHLVRCAARARTASVRSQA